MKAKKIKHNLLANQINNFFSDNQLQDPKLKAFLKEIEKTYLNYVPETNTKLEEEIIPEKYFLECLISEDYNILELNDNLAKNYNQANVNLIGLNFFDVIHSCKEDFDFFKQNFEKLSPEESILKISQKGEETNRHWNIQATFDNQSNLKQIYCCAYDFSNFEQISLKKNALYNEYTSISDVLYSLNQTIFKCDIDMLIKRHYESGKKANFLPLRNLEGGYLYEYFTENQKLLLFKALKKLKNKPTEVTVSSKDLDNNIIFLKVTFAPIIDNKKEFLCLIREITHEREREQKIKRLEVLHKGLMHSITQSLCIVDKNNKIIDSNKSFQEFMGYSKSKLLNTNFKKYIIREDIVKLKEFENGLKVKKSTELRIIKKTGGIVPIRVNKTFHPYREEENYIYSFSSIEGKVDETEIEKNKQELFKELSNHIPLYIYIKDQKGNILFMNKIMADKFDINQKNIEGKQHKDLFNKNLATFFEQDDQEFWKQSSQNFFQRSRIIKVNGKEEEWNMGRKRLESLYTEESFLLFYANNITEEAKAKKQVTESNKRFKQLVEYSEDVIHRTTAGGRFLYFNPTIHRITGYTKDDLSQKLASDLIVENERQDVITFYEEQVKNREKNTYKEFSVLTKKGTILRIGQNVRLFYENGKPYFQTIARDITEQVATAKELERTKKLAEESLRAKEKFLSTISHEIRNPLHAISGITRFLLEEESREDEKQLLQAIIFSSNNILSLVNDLLDFSKINSGKIRFENTEFDLKTNLKQMKQSLMVKAEENSNSLNFYIDSNVPNWLIGDTTRLSQILYNLLGNALKFTQEGDVELSVSVKKNNPKNIVLLFKVSDNGIGIPENKLKSIFEYNKQAKTAIVKSYGGSGIGLYITKTLIEKQGGKIEVKSKEGLGSAFIFELNFRKGEKNNPLIAHKNPQVFFFKNVKVLAAEDDFFNQKVIKTILEKRGVKVDFANNGNQVLDKIQEEVYDIVLMDLQMPEMDGYEAAQHLRKKFKLTIPIIAVTGETDENTLERLIDIGIDDQVSKPFSPEVLQEKLIQYIPPHKYYESDKKTLETNKKPKVKKLIDLSYLNEVAQGQSKILKEMTRIYTKQTENFIKNLEEALIKEDWSDIPKIIHKAKPVFESLGVKKALEILEDFRQDTIDFDKGIVLLKDLRDIREKTIKELLEIT